jgi:hypothetical protein
MNPQCGMCPPYPSAGSSVDLTSATVSLNAAAAVASLNSGGSFTVGGSGSLTVSGTLTHSGTFSVSGIFSGATLKGEGGSFTLSGSATVNTVTHQGNVTVNSTGSLDVNTSMSHEGTFSISGAANVEKLTANDPLTISGGSLILGSESECNSNFTFNGGQLLGAKLTLKGPGTWSAGLMFAGGPTEVDGDAELNLNGSGIKEVRARNLNNSGTVTWTGSGQLWLNEGTVLDNADDATFDAQNNAVVDSSIFPPGVLKNEGTWKKTSSAGVTRFERTIFHNAGMVEIETGTVELAGGGTNTGSVNISGGALLDFVAGQVYTLAAGSSISGDGAARISGVVEIPASVNVPAENVQMPGGLRTGPGTLTISNDLERTGGTMFLGGTTMVGANATLEISGSAIKSLEDHTLNHFGSGLWSGTGTLDLRRGSPFNIRSGATLEVDTGLLADAGIFPPGMINNAGTYRKLPGGAVNRFFRAFFNNSGRVEVQGGTLQLAGGGTNTGVFNISGGATVEFDAGQLYNLDSGSAISGNGFAQLIGSVNIPAGVNVLARNFRIVSGLRVGAGTLTVSNALEWSGGTMFSGGTTVVSPAANLTISGGAIKTLTSHTLNHFGSGSWTGTGTVDLSRGNATWIAGNISSSGNSIKELRIALIGDSASIHGRVRVKKGLLD